MSIAAFSHPHQVVTVLSGRWHRVIGLTAEQRELVKQRLTIRNGRRAQQIQYRGRPDDNEAEELYGYFDPMDGDLQIAPGATPLLRTILPRHVEIIHLDERPAHRLQYRAPQRPYQDAFVRDMMAQPFGMGVGPCGSGKTNTALDLMCRRGGRWLIVVRQTDLVRQWAARVTSATSGSVTIYKPQNRVKWNPYADFIVATAQALIRHPDHCYQIDLERDGLCVDECDEMPCNEMVSLAQLFSPRYRIGFTATPNRPDGLTPLMYWWIGPKLAEIPREVVEGEGHLLRPRLLVHETGWGAQFALDLDGRPVEVKKRKRKVEALVDDAIHDQSSRAGEVAQIVENLWSSGRKVLVPVDSIAYGYWIMQALIALGVPCEFAHAAPGKDRIDGIAKQMAALDLPVTGESLRLCTKKHRIAILDRVAKGETSVLIATSLADRGLDLPILDAAVIATPGGAARRIEQQCGRVCRPLAGKPQPLIVYVLDSGVSRVETVTSAETGERVRTVTRPLVARFRRNYYSVFKKLADCDAEAVRRVLKGENRDDPQPASEPLRAA